MERGHDLAEGIKDERKKKLTLRSKCGMGTVESQSQVGRDV